MGRRRRRGNGVGPEPEAGARLDDRRRRRAHEDGAVFGQAVQPALVGREEEGRGQGAVDEHGASASASSSCAFSLSFLVALAAAALALAAFSAAAADGARQEDDAPGQPARDEGPQLDVDDYCAVLEVLEAQRREGRGAGGGRGSGAATAAERGFGQPQRLAAEAAQPRGVEGAVCDARGGGLGFCFFLLCLSLLVLSLCLFSCSCSCCCCRRRPGGGDGREAERRRRARSRAAQSLPGRGGPREERLALPGAPDLRGEDGGLPLELGEARRERVEVERRSRGCSDVDVDGFRRRR